MLTMGSYVLYIEQKTLNRYILMTVLFILGLMSKSMLVTLPFALILLDWWPLGRLCPDLSMKAQWGRIRQMVWEKIPLFILSGVFALIAWLSAEHIGTVPLFPLYERLANVFRSYAIYLVKLIWPSDLAVFYPYPEGIILWQIVGAALVLAVITGLVLWMRKRYPFLIVGWLWYLGTLLPVIGIIQAGGQAYADRYTYIPLIGLFIMVAWGIPSLLKQWRYRKEAFFTLSALSILCLFFITWTQVGYWQNDITLFEHAIKANGSNFVAYNNAGIAYGHLGNYRQAIRDFDRAIKINPDYAETYYNRGITYGSLNNYGQAVRDFDRAIKIYPGYVKAFYNRGIIYGSLGNYGQAVRDFDRAIKINPYYAEAYYNRGVTYDKLGNYRQAIEDLKTAARFGHNNAQNFLISRGIKW
jgi:tetratricopeptide (TPR) repeat protein